MYFRCVLTQDAQYIKIRIYTMGFRAIEEITIPGTVTAGRVDRNLPSWELSRLANGIYYYTVAAVNENGVKAKSGVEVLIVLR